MERPRYGTYLGCQWAVEYHPTVACSDFVEVDGCMALADSVFADDMKGWALVRVLGDRCSSQGLVTRCRYYEQHTTKEALQEAAKSYGGLTK